MKYVISILMVVLCAFSTNIFCSQPKELKVKTMKTALSFYFTDQKTIAAIKDEIEGSEGLPVSQQRLIKQEGWAFGFPPTRVVTELADNQTCGFYDLCDKQEVHLWVKMPKTQAQIEAELQARRQAITAALLQRPLSQPLVFIVAGYGLNWYHSSMHKLFLPHGVLFFLALHTPSSAMCNRLSRTCHLLSSRYAAAATVGVVWAVTLSGQSAVIHTNAEPQSKKIQILQQAPSFEQKQAIKNAFCDKLIASASGAVAKQYLEELATEEESLKQELYKLVNIRPEEFQNRFLDYYNYYSKQEHIPCPVNIDASSVRVIEQSDRESIDAVLDKAGVDKKFINFVYCKYTEPWCGFGAGFNTVFIDQSEIQENKNLYKATIAHELVHVLFDDWVIKAVVSHYCKKENKDFKSKYQTLKEKRADILGGLLSSECTYANSCRYSKLIPWNGPPTHPENSVRAAYLYKLYTQTDPEYIEREERCQKERQDLFYGFCAA